MDLKARLFTNTYNINIVEEEQCNGIVNHKNGDMKAFGLSKQ